jgi:hypothetical protein
VRETVLDIGREAALGLEEWEQALDFSREEQQSIRERGGTSFDLAYTAFNDYGPLLRLKRYGEAGKLLRDCREVFDRENSIEMLGKVFSALAALEDELGRSLTALHFGETALRYTYTRGDPDDAAIGHFNIANYIIKRQGPWSDALAHRLAAVLIGVALQSGRAARNLATLVRNLRDAGPEGRTALPPDFAALCATVEKIEGVRFREMIERLVGGAAECDQLFRNVVATALEAANKPE